MSASSQNIFSAASPLPPVTAAPSCLCAISHHARRADCKGPKTLNPKPLKSSLQRPLQGAWERGPRGGRGGSRHLIVDQQLRADRACRSDDGLGALGDQQPVRVGRVW